MGTWGLLGDRPALSFAVPVCGRGPVSKQPQSHSAFLVLCPCWPSWGLARAGSSEHYLKETPWD